MPESLLTMFTKSARYYDALYHFKDYAAASGELRDWLLKYNPDARSLLDVACGTGKHIEQLRKYYDVEGLDLNPELLEIARKRCPGITFHQANMIDFDLGKTFDVVTCLFSSIGYVKTLENLQRAVASMSRHLRRGGVLVLEPWFSPEKYWTGTITANFVNEPDLKIAWMYTSEVKGRVGILDINYLVGTPQGVEHFKELHEIGLFTEDEYRDSLLNAGLEVDYDPKGLFGRGMYIGVKGKRESKQ
jgi:ubiquinone/menaquinone biosynthesis C-methylase UbiE